MATTSGSDNAHFERSKLFDVSHITAVVTGGGTGIGLMITQALVANGAKVYITGRRKEALETVVKTYSTGPGSIHALPGDVSDKTTITELADQVAKQEPNGIQLLVNNAGIARDQATQFSKNDGPPDMKDADAIHNYFIKSDPQAWEDTFRTNVTGQFFMSIAFLPLLKKGADTAKKQNSLLSSSVINVSSISGSMKGTSGGQPAYAASKAAYSHVTRMLATTFKDVGVRVNCIAPGVFPSEMTTGKSDADNKSKLESEASNPAGRYGHDSDMAATVLFLAGPGGTFYNEQFLYPDGGNTLVQPAFK